MGTAIATIWIMGIILGGTMVPVPQVTGKTASECLINASQEIVKDSSNDTNSVTEAVVCIQIPQIAYDNLQKKLKEKKEGPKYD